MQMFGAQVHNFLSSYISCTCTWHMFLPHCLQYTVDPLCCGVSKRKNYHPNYRDILMGRHSLMYLVVNR